MTSFVVNEKSLNTLFKGSAFATDTTKIYLSTLEGNVIGELGDKARHNTDSFTTSLCDTFKGLDISDSIPINFESFRLINFTKCEEATFKINQQLGVIICVIKKEDILLTYVISALIN